MMKIVLPTDFSENAFHAIAYALKLLQDHTCRFYLVHTYTPPIYRVDYTLGSPGQLGLPDVQRNSVEETLEDTIKTIKPLSNPAKHTFVSHAAFNTLAEEMDSISHKEGVDFIVMGTQGATGAMEILFGSNTVQVIQKSAVPVLVIPNDFEYEPPRNILFPTDYEVDYQKAHLDFLLKFSKLEHSKLHILHISSPEGLDEGQINQKVRLEGKLLEHNHEFYDLPDQELIPAINAFQEKHPVELLVMVKNKHSFLERLFLDPVIKKIGLYSKVPFMVLPYTT